MNSIEAGFTFKTGINNMKTILACVLASLLVACGGGDNEAPATPAQPIEHVLPEACKANGEGATFLIHMWNKETGLLMQTQGPFWSKTLALNCIDVLRLQYGAVVYFTGTQNPTPHQTSSGE